MYFLSLVPTITAMVTRNNMHWQSWAQVRKKDKLRASFQILRACGHPHWSSVKEDRWKSFSDLIVLNCDPAFLQALEHLKPPGLSTEPVPPQHSKEVFSTVSTGHIYAPSSTVLDPSVIGDFRPISELSSSHFQNLIEDELVSAHARFRYWFWS